MLKKSNKNEVQALEWLVVQRSRNQQAALSIYKIIDREQKQLTSSPEHRKFAQSLLGICFSLWRAVFLANLKQSKGALHEQATAFLKELIETNNISFQTDLKNNDWSFRYYMKTARFRLKYLYNSFKEKKLSFSHPGKAEGNSPQEWWEDLQNSLDGAIKAFDKLLKQNRKPNAN